MQDFTSLIKHWHNATQRIKEVDACGSDGAQIDNSLHSCLKSLIKGRWYQEDRRSYKVYCLVLGTLPCADMCSCSCCGLTQWVTIQHIGASFPTRVWALLEFEQTESWQLPNVSGCGRRPASKRITAPGKYVLFKTFQRTTAIAMLCVATPISHGM